MSKYTKFIWSEYELFFEINFGSIFIELKYSYIFWLHYSENSKPKIEEIMLKKKSQIHIFFIVHHTPQVSIWYSWSNKGCHGYTNS